MPRLTPEEALEVATIHSLADVGTNGEICRERPYRDPHHSASMAAMIGGGKNARPGEISLAHRGVLFLDELPEFARPVLEAMGKTITHCGPAGAGYTVKLCNQIHLIVSYICSWFAHEVDLTAPELRDVSVRKSPAGRVRTTFLF